MSGAEYLAILCKTLYIVICLIYLMSSFQNHKMHSVDKVSTPGINNNQLLRFTSILEDVAFTQNFKQSTKIYPDNTHNHQPPINSKKCSFIHYYYEQ